MNAQTVRDKLVKLLTDIPNSKVVPADDPEAQIEKLINTAAWKAGAISGALAIPAGPIAWVTAVPDLFVVWRIQAQLVADIARVKQKTEYLNPELLVYCLFRDENAGLADIATRVGQRLFVRRGNQKFLQSWIEKSGLRIVRRLAGKRLGAFIPILGAALMGRFARTDTLRVGQWTREVFEGEIQEG